MKTIQKIHQKEDEKGKGYTVDSFRDALVVREGTGGLGGMGLHQKNSMSLDKLQL